MFANVCCRCVRHPIIWLKIESLTNCHSHRDRVSACRVRSNNCASYIFTLSWCCTYYLVDIHVTLVLLLPFVVFSRTCMYNVMYSELRWNRGLGHCIAKWCSIPHTCEHKNLSYGIFGPTHSKCSRTQMSSCKDKILMQLVFQQKYTCMYGSHAVTQCPASCCRLLLCVPERHLDSRESLHFTQLVLLSFQNPWH